MKSYMLTIIFFTLAPTIYADPIEARKKAKEIVDRYFVIRDVPNTFLPKRDDFLGLIPKISKDFHLVVLEAGAKRAVETQDRYLVKMLPGLTSEGIVSSFSRPHAQNFASLISVVTPDEKYNVDEDIWDIVRDTKNPYAQEAIREVFSYALSESLEKYVNKTYGHPALRIMLHLRNASKIQSELQLDFFKLVASIKHRDYGSAFNIMGITHTMDAYTEIYEYLPYIRSGYQVEAFRNLVASSLEIAHRRSSFSEQIHKILMYMRPFLHQLEPIASSKMRLDAFNLCLEVLQKYRGVHYEYEGHKNKDIDKDINNTLYNEILPKLSRINSAVRIQFARKMVFPELGSTAIIDLRWFAKIEESESNLVEYMTAYGKEKVPLGTHPESVFSKLLRFCGLK